MTCTKKINRRRLQIPWASSTIILCGVVLTPKLCGQLHIIGGDEEREKETMMNEIKWCMFLSAKSCACEVHNITHGCRNHCCRFKLHVSDRSQRTQKIHSGEVGGLKFLDLYPCKRWKYMDHKMLSGIAMLRASLEDPVKCLKPQNNRVFTVLVQVDP